MELAGRDVRERVAALAAEYVAFARDNRALFDLMWRATQFDFNDPDLTEQKQRAFAALYRGLRGPDAQLPHGPDLALVPSYAVWSLVHGYTCLALEGAFGDDIPDPLTSDLLPLMLGLVDVTPAPRLDRGGPAALPARCSPAG